MRKCTFAEENKRFQETKTLIYSSLIDGLSPNDNDIYAWSEKGFKL